MSNPIGSLDALQEENRRLRRAVEELSIINDLSRTISAALDPDEIMSTIIRRSMRAVNAEQGVITLVEQAKNDPMKTLVRAMVSSADQEKFHMNQALLGWMHLNKKPLLINDPRNDSRFKGVDWELTVSSLLCVPMTVKSEMKGVLTMYNKKGGGGFTADDQRLLAIIAGQSAQVMENARLNENEKQFLKMQQEVKLAATIQADLLPKTAPTVAGYDIAGRNIPVQDVGGDHFDFIPIDEHRIAVCLGDVSGKGLPASLLMANIQATLRSHALMDLSAQECATRSNRLLYHSTSPEKFVTLFYGIIDVRTHRLNYFNAGHEHPYVFSGDSAPIRLGSGGIMLGMIEDFPFQEETITLSSGSVMVIVSDGVTEAMNSLHEQFGDHRLAEVVRQYQEFPASQLIDHIVAAVTSHVGSAPQLDDITLVVVKRFEK